jgi:citrate lyase subunit beta/citryl-CoA lyase
MKNDFLMKSLIFVPGLNERLMNSASKSNADVLFLDIEDSVQPINNKQIARDLILKFLGDGKFKNRIIFLKVND